MKPVFAFLAAVLAATLFFSAAHAAGYLKIGDIKGESATAGKKPQGHKGEIELESISWGGAAAPRGAGPGTLTVTMKRGAHSDALAAAARARTVFSSMTLRLPDAAARGGYLTYKLEDVYISSYQTHGSADAPTEEVAFYYAGLDD